MIFKCQTAALHSLEKAAESRVHSILIDGPKGSGKTYISNEYAKMIGTSDIVSVDPDVKSIRSMIQSCYDISSDVVVCIENLDAGVPGASYALLKFLEEPADNVFIIVTCRNRYQVPDTIISRCMCSSVSSPVKDDICSYFATSSKEKFQTISNSKIWKAVTTFSDVDMVCSLSDDQIRYLLEQASCKFSDSVYNLSWSFTKYPDGSDVDVLFLLKLIMCTTSSSLVKKAAVSCSEDLLTKRVAKGAALSKFFFDCKYVK